MNARLNHNDEAVLRLVLQTGSPDGYFSAPLSMLAGVFAEIDGLRALRPVAIAAADPIPHPACRTRGECRRENLCMDGWQCASAVEADEFAPHDTPDTVAESLL